MKTLTAVADFFSQSYQEAREKFLAQAEAAGAVLVDSIENPNQGPDGGRLFTDVARIGPALLHSPPIAVM